MEEIEQDEETAKDDLDLLYEEIQRKRNEQELVPASSSDQSASRDGVTASSLGSLLLAFLSLLAFINQICYVQANRQQQLIES